MRCPSCGAVSEISDCCGECGAEITGGKVCSQSHPDTTCEVKMHLDGDNSNLPETTKSSTLIEFPGVTRSSLPDWRKELSERVREVQERRAREAAREAAEARYLQVDGATAPPQLELLPQAEAPPLNPLVAAALKRIERARQSGPVESRNPGTVAATAVAYAPEREDNDVLEPVMVSAPAQPTADVAPGISEVDLIATPAAETWLKPEKSHGLVVLEPSVAGNAVPAPPPKRLILDDPNDPALNYLDSISRNVRVEEIDGKRASLFRRLVCGLFDLVISALLTSPIPIAVKLTGTSFNNPRAIVFIAASFVTMTFIYLTLTTALTGRTWAMRLLSLRIIDRKTGLIPTGGQSVGRSFIYLISLAAAGLGILFALVSREGYTAHDHFTRTAVVAT